MPSNANAKNLQKDQTFVTTKHENHQNIRKKEIIDVKYNEDSTKERSVTNESHESQSPKSARKPKETKTLTNDFTTPEVPSSNLKVNPLKHLSSSFKPHFFKSIGVQVSSGKRYAKKLLQFYTEKLYYFLCL